MNKKRGITYAILGCLFWGASGTMAEFTFEHYAISPIWLVGVRLFFAGILLLLWYKAESRTSILEVWKVPKTGIGLAAFAFLGVVPSQLTYFMAIKHGNAPTATVLQFLGPIFIILFLAVSTRTAPRRIDVVSVIVALIGTFLLVTNGRLQTLSLSPTALMWGIGAGLGQASYTLLPRKLLQLYDTKLVVGWSMLIGSTLFLFFPQPLPALSLPLIGNISFIIAFGTMFAYLFYLSSLRDIAPTTTGMLSAFEPLTATILSLLFLGTLLSPAQLVGGCLIVSTIFLQALPLKRILHLTK